MGFHHAEQGFLQSLEERLRKVEEWPEDSPLAFVIHLAPRTRGRLGELLLDEIAASVGLASRGGTGADFDRYLVTSGGEELRIESKFSTEDPPRFQQVRDPRRDDSFKYDYLMCISGRPDGLTYWALSAAQVAEAMDAGAMIVQHAMSDTKWFFPLRDGTDYFSEFRHDFASLCEWLKSL